jgi:hypothetical protein
LFTAALEPAAYGRRMSNIVVQCIARAGRWFGMGALARRPPSRRELPEATRLFHFDFPMDRVIDV